MTEKPRNPFLPGQPTTVDLFVGRQAQIRHLLERGVRQTALGKPTAFFLEGEYGIGKSSLANYCALAAEGEFGLLAITASMAGQKDLRGVAEAILKAIVQTAHRHRPLWKRVATSLSRFVKSANLFGVDLDLHEIAKEAAHFADIGSFLSTLQRLIAELPTRADWQRGILLVLDEINGVAAEPAFAHFLKGVVDRNALATEQVPLCLVLCGTPERRHELIANHQPVGRIFDVIEVPPLSAAESREFFERSFRTVDMRLDPVALDQLVQFGSGQPRILHMLGDQAFWIDQDGVIDVDDANSALIQAAADFTSRYVGPQILAELRSAAYRSILTKIAGVDPLQPSFQKSAIADGLEESERRKLDNFLQRMKRLNVLRQGSDKGEWVFNTPMVRTAIWLFAKAGQG